MEEPETGDMFCGGEKLGQAINGDEDTGYGMLREGCGRGGSGESCGDRIGSGHCGLHEELFGGVEVWSEGLVSLRSLRESDSVVMFCMSPTRLLHNGGSSDPPFADQ